MYAIELYLIRFNKKRQYKSRLLGNYSNLVKLEISIFNG